MVMLPVWLEPWLQPDFDTSVIVDVTVTCFVLRFASAWLESRLYARKVDASDAGTLRAGEVCDGLGAWEMETCEAAGTLEPGNSRRWAQTDLPLPQLTSIRGGALRSTDSRIALRICCQLFQCRPRQLRWDTDLYGVKQRLIRTNPADQARYPE